MPGSLPPDEATSERHDDAALVRQQGWKQGSVAGDDLLGDIKPDSMALILSHDCDVTNPSFDKEPHVELVWLEPLNEPAGPMTLGKNSRELHLRLGSAVLGLE